MDEENTGEYIPIFYLEDLQGDTTLPAMSSESIGMPSSSIPATFAIVVVFTPH